MTGQPLAKFFLLATSSSVLLRCFPVLDVEPVLPHLASVYSSVLHRRKGSGDRAASQIEKMTTGAFPCISFACLHEQQVQLPVGAKHQLGGACHCLARSLLASPEAACDLL